MRRLKMLFWGRDFHSHAEDEAEIWSEELDLHRWLLCLAVLVHAFSRSEPDLLNALQWKKIANHNWKQIEPRNQF